MWPSIIATLTLFTGFCLLDRILSYCSIPHLFLHFYAAHNAALTLLTICDVIDPFTYPLHNAFALPLWISFHLYHFILYEPTFEEEDTYHIMERLFALCLGWYAHSPALIGYTLFFVSLPAGIDYLLLLHGNHESKRTWINQWIYLPACVVHHGITIVYLMKTKFDTAPFWACIMSMWMVHSNWFYYDYLCFRYLHPKKNN
jgi:hypothetical protein